MHASAQQPKLHVGMMLIFVFAEVIGKGPTSSDTVSSRNALNCVDWIMGGVPTFRVWVNAFSQEAFETSAQMLTSVIL